MQIQVRTFVEEFTELQEEIQIDETQFFSFLSENLKDQYVKIGKLYNFSFGLSYSEKYLINWWFIWKFGGLVNCPKITV